MATKNLSMADLERELSRRQNALSKLEGKLKGLLGQVSDVETEMANIRGTATGRKRGPGRPRTKTGKKPGPKKGAKASRRGGRAKNSVTLPEAIAQAMDKGAIVSPKEASALVLANGYKTSSKTFGIQVATTLAKDKRFKKMARAQYKRVK